MNNSEMNPCRYFIIAAILIAFSTFRAHAQTPCIETVPIACLGDSALVLYVGNKPPTANYKWSISCGTITNPTLQNPHVASFNSPGLCSIQLIVQEPGTAPETCTVEVQVLPLPLGTLTLSKDTICDGDCLTMHIVFQGTPPFNFQVMVNNTVNNFSTDSSSFSLQVCPRSNTTFKLVSITDQHCTNTNPNSHADVVVQLPFTGTVAQRNNMLCATPSNLKYAWYACNGNILLSTQQCFSPTQNGCYCVVMDNGICKDTVCTNFVCNLTCSFAFPDTILVGDTALIHYTGNGGPNTFFDWTIFDGSIMGKHYTGIGLDTLKIKYNVPGCFPIQLNIREANCLSACADTICVISKPCTCDTFTKNKIALIPGTSCCYDVNGKVSSYSCFTGIQILLSTGSFNNVQADIPAGWSVQSNGNQEIKYTHNSGFIPPGVFHAGTFCVSGATTYSVTVRYLYSNLSFGDTCSYQYTFDCKQPPAPPKCDSLNTYLEKQHTLPTFCCFNIHTDNPHSNLYNQIHVSVNSGTFSNFVANSGSGFYLIPGGSQDFSIGHNSGFIPNGQTIPGSFCITAATNPITVTINYYFTGPLGKDSCTFQFTFDCPGANPPNCCDSTSMQLLPYGIQPNCCYDVHANSTKSKCFSQICFKTTSGGFTNIVANPGWTSSITVNGFCFIPTSMFIPPGPINPGSFCIAGSTNPITITAEYLDANGMKLDSCKKTFVENCPPPPKSCSCDSLTNKVTAISITPGLCCYSLQGSVPVSNCYTSIGVQLSAGSFTNIATTSGWSYLSGGQQSFTLTHSSGFVPSGTINPSTFCVTGATTYTISVNYYFTNNSGKKDTCKFKYTFDCPQAPKPCNCDSLTNMVNQTSVIPGLCCYDLEGQVPTANCFTQIHVFLSSGSFTNIQNGPGWSHVSNSSQYFTLTHSSGFVPSGTIIPASFCVTGSTFYMITVNYIYTKNNGLKDSCSFKYTFDCPNPPKPCSCDSLTNNINQTSSTPGLCCYAMQGSVPKANCFTSIQVLLNSGGFTNIQNGIGWTHVSNTAQSFTLTTNSGFIPSGTINPATFCVTGSTFYSITVYYYFNNNGAKDSCKFNYTFDCPNAPKPCNCDSLTNTINQTSVTPGLCCYDLEGSVPTSNCFTQIHMILSSGSFTNIQDGIGWTHVLGGSQYINLSNNAGFIPPGIITPASFCVTSSTFYTITVNYIYTKNNGLKDSCSFKYTFDCPNIPKPCNCDSLTNAVNQTSAVPGLCCYKIQGNVPTANCFTSMQVLLSSGSFANVVAGSGWIASANNAQSFNLNPNTNYIPTGIINPATFCVTGSTSYMISVYYFYNGNNGLKDTCKFKYTFDCPAKVDSLCDQSNCTSGSKAWQIVGNGTTFVYDMVVYQCKLIVAGQFNQVGSTAASNIAAWDGYNWTPLAQGVNGIVKALAVHNGILYVGGQFTTAGTTSNVNNIAAWNGSTWSHLDNGVTGNGPVFVGSLLSTANGLIVGGTFQNAGLTSSLATNNIAQWNGSSWNNNFNSLSNIFNGPIYTLREYNGSLYAAGTFNTPQLNTARWNGTNWLGNGTGITLVNNVPYNGVAAQFVYNGNLIVGGHFLNAGGVSVTQHIASWNGSNWSSMTGGDLPDTIDAVHDFIKYNNKLYAGGAITQMGSTLLHGVGEWNGINWNNTGHPLAIVWALEAYDSCGTLSCDLYSGGEGAVRRWVCLTANNNIERSVDFYIQPNPAKDNIQIVFNHINNSSNANLHLLNVQGKVLSELNHVNKEMIEWDISRLSPGIYFIEYFDRLNAPIQKMFIKM